MSSYNLQAGQIRGALIAAGLPAVAATNIANILGNAAQTMRHAGALEHDRTPASMRLVDPDTRKHSLTHVDFRPADPDYRAERASASEGTARPAPESPVVVAVAPQQTPAQQRVLAGAFMDVAAAGQAARVGVRVAGAGSMLFADQRANNLVARSYRAEANGFGADVRMFIETNNQEVVWKLQMNEAAGQYERGVEVVTDVKMIPGQGLEITKQKVSGYFGETSKARVATSRISVVTDLSLGGGLTGNRAFVDVLHAEQAPPSTVPVSDCE